MESIVRLDQHIASDIERGTFEAFQCQGEPEQLIEAIVQTLDIFFTASDWEVSRGLSHVVFSHKSCEITIAAKSADAKRTAVSSPFAARHQMTDIMIISRNSDAISNQAYLLAVDFLRVYCSSYSSDEVDLIRGGFPLLASVSAQHNFENDNVALIFRDHFLEDNLGFLLSCKDSGINPRWIFALSKGDRTLKRDRIASYLKSLHFNVGLFDNAAFDSKAFDENTSSVYGLIEQFVLQAKAAGRRVILIDDGALMPMVFGQRQHLIDFTIELTIIGIKRLSKLASLSMPILDLARSKLKTALVYPEISDACFRRVRHMLSDEKFSGRTVIIAGYGNAGRPLAQKFRSIGCQVVVVDVHKIPLICAAEEGFRTFSSLRAALEQHKPMLVVGCSGEVSIGAEDLDLIPNGCYLTGIATRDLSEINKNLGKQQIVNIPGFGNEYRLADGRVFYQLGDGRSVNLFESDSIPNKAGDIFRSAVLILLASGIRTPEKFCAGINLNQVDDVLLESGIYDAYYETYLEQAGSPK
ncbi:hypothetical protein [Pseudomonas sp. B16120]|jgi:adenosylhomocysteinase|uniref:hypothetical protein n=1 Tax=Pseudomonas sp. B16120 TaxID=3235108 RepID=UPI003783F8C7